MMSHLPIESQDATHAAPASAPTALNAAQVNVTSTGDIQVVVRESGPGEPWFQMLRREFEDGTWAALQDRHRNVLPVMCSLRDRETGLAYAPAADFQDAAGVRHPGLLARTGISKTALYSAIAEMTAEPSSVPLDAKAHLRAAAGLLARCGRDLFVVLPDRVFAGRRPVPTAASRFPSTGVPFPSTGIAPESFPSTGKLSHPRESSRQLHRETRARSELELRKNTVDDDGLSLGAEQTEAMRLLCQGLPPRHGGFDARDAQNILSTSAASLMTVKTAVANAARVARSKSGLRNWRGYVRTQLEKGCTLFPDIERERDNALRVTERLVRCAAEFGDESACALLQQWHRGSSNRDIARLVVDPSWREGDEAFWGSVTRRVLVRMTG